MISKEEVLKIAKLSRLELTEAETEKMQKDLSSILNYFNLLQSASAPSEGFVETRKVNVFRADEAKLRDPRVAETLVTQAPDKKDGYIKVKAVL